MASLPKGHSFRVREVCDDVSGSWGNTAATVGGPSQKDPKGKPKGSQRYQLIGDSSFFYVFTVVSQPDRDTNIVVQVM